MAWNCTNDFLLVLSRELRIFYVSQVLLQEKTHPHDYFWLVGKINNWYDLFRTDKWAGEDEDDVKDDWDADTESEDEKSQPKEEVFTYLI